MQSLHSRSVLLTGTDPEQKRNELRAYFHRTCDIYEKLFEVLVSDDALYQRPEPLRHPLIFYFGHTATFFVNKLILAKAIPSRINPRFESMFAIGVDEMSWDDLNDANYDWPPVPQVREYRHQVRQLVDGVIDRLDLRLPIAWDDHPAWAVLMGIEHERIHLETSSVLIRQLDKQWVRPDPSWPICPDHGNAPTNRLKPVPGGEVVLGKSRDNARLYGWDNEYGEHRAQVEGFQAAQHLVSNAEYLQFIHDGGYRENRWWSDEGANWLAYTHRRHPIFWVEAGESYRLRTLTEEIPMPWNWPVEVNYLEAKAFCNWKAEQTGKSIRLPSEDEWYRLRDWLEIPDEPEWPQPAPWNINLEHYASSVPVDRFGKDGFFDVIGNVWQWTETPIHGFKGFEIHPIYDDFSTPTFDNKHNLIKGGSWIATGNEATRDSRYAFRRHFYQHAGFRYVEAGELPPLAELPNEDYETDKAVAEYCEFHYGDPYYGVPNFPKALADHAIAAHQGATTKALDLGCAVGRSTFELARTFDEVIGIDFSARFIRQAISLQENGLVSYNRIEEGDITTPCEKSLEQLGFLGLETKVAFWQGDAHNLKPQFTGFDLILAANLIDRLYEPRRFLENIQQRLNPGGTLMLTSPYTWLEEYTERENWLGGYIGENGPVYTLDTLKEILGKRFDLIQGPDKIPFVIRETRHKHQHTLSEVTVWRLRD
jgi:5-histidylcysteine sulfoxide synthase/putative 4-mercaptohistidine N1-methyltranferase